MSVLAQLAVIFAVCLVGEGISALLPIPFPATVLAMVILLCRPKWSSRGSSRNPATFCWITWPFSLCPDACRCSNIGM